ncbi:MAG TPA: hypothetical protein VHP34_04665, partial [Alphaproteobacteria bacterium]|nr:hypothetical protein [Alphaproteobacteria bacterium]
DKRVGIARQVLNTEIPVTDGKALSWLYQRGEVIERHDDEETAYVAVSLEPEDAARFTDQFPYRFRKRKARVKKDKNKNSEESAA